MVEWSRMISIQLNQLESLASIADANAGAILSRLGREAQSGYADAEKVSNLEHRKQWRCASYSVIRRAEVWKAVWAAINTDANAAQWKTSEADPLYHHLGEAITSVANNYFRKLAIKLDGHASCFWMNFGKLNPTAAPNSLQRIAN